MAYIGLPPSNSFVSLKRQVITGDGTASYTLDHSVASVNDVAIFVNNVRQDPAGYSISGTTLTLGGTIQSSDDCYVIFLGQALQTVTPDSNAITAAILQSSSVTPAKLNLDSGITVTTSDNSDNLTLTSTDADANAGPNLRLHRNSSSPADSDLIGNIQFEGRNDNSEDVVYAEISGRANDVSDGTEDGLIFIKAMTDGTLTEYMRFDPGSNGIVVNDNSGDIDFRIETDDDTHMLFVDASTDRIGISTNSPGRTLDIAGQLRTQQSDSGTESTPNFEIVGGGYNARHFLDTNSYFIGQNSQNRNLRMYSGNNKDDGVNLSPNANSWGTYSDERLKKDITDLTNGLDKISAMRPVNFKYKSDAEDFRNRIGIIAQSIVGQVDEALDQTKISDDDTLYYNVRYQDLIPVLVKAIQEQQTKIEELETRIQTLENN